MSRSRKHESHAARTAASRAEMIARGWRPVQVWLSPEQVAKLGTDKSATIRRMIDLA